MITVVLYKTQTTLTDSRFPGSNTHNGTSLVTTEDAFRGYMETTTRFSVCDE